MRRWKPVAVLVGLVLVAGALILQARLVQNRITPANFARIHPGMTRADVEAILGPPGDFTTRESIILDPPSTDSRYWPAPRRVYEDWITDSNGVEIAFDPATGLVEEIGRLEVCQSDQPLYEVLLWRVQRLWHRWFR
jgi:hypothetical protein